MVTNGQQHAINARTYPINALLLPRYITYWNDRKDGYGGVLEAIKRTLDQLTSAHISIHIYVNSRLSNLKVTNKK